MRIIKLVDVDKMNASLTVTMPVEDWRRLREDLRKNATSYIGNALNRMIGELVDKAAESFDKLDEVQQ